LKSKPANGAWGDPMTVGFSADTVEVSPVPFLFPAHETKPEVISGVNT